jgi:hypothetical protein
MAQQQPKPTPRETPKPAPPRDPYPRSGPFPAVHKPMTAIKTEDSDQNKRAR